jgi:rod shape-determining protein MreB and related proteins
MSLFFLDQFLSRFSQDIGIDLGTANTPIIVCGRGVKLREPSVVAIDNRQKKVIAVGHEAKMMQGRNPSHIDVIRPIRDGVIADFDVAYEMIKYFMRRVAGQGIVKPRVIVGVPSDVTDVERRAVHEAVRTAGARAVYIVSQPLAAAIGADLPVLEPRGSMILDIGGGTSEIAVVSMGGIVFTNSIRVAGDEMDEAIINYLRRVRSFSVGERTAEDIKIEIGCAFKVEFPEVMKVSGMDLNRALPGSINVSSNEIHEALDEIIRRIAELVTTSLETIPPEMVGDVVEQGVMLTGGGSLLRGLDQYLTRRTGVNCTRVQDPLSTVAFGAEKLFKDQRLMRVVFGAGRERELDESRREEELW